MIARSIVDIFYTEGLTKQFVGDEPSKSLLALAREICRESWSIDTKDGTFKFYEFSDFSLLKVEIDEGNTIVRTFGYECNTIIDDEE